jgi:hypothetical protein
MGAFYMEAPAAKFKPAICAAHAIVALIHALRL